MADSSADAGDISEVLHPPEGTRRADAEYHLIEELLKRGVDSGGRHQADRMAVLRSRFDQAAHLQLRTPGISSRYGISQLDALVAEFGSPLRTGWLTANLPYLQEQGAATVPPGLDETNGTIETFQLVPGGVTFEINVSTSGNQSTDAEAWWGQEWFCSCVLPPAPYSGKLYYRFTAVDDLYLSNAGAENGVLDTYVDVSAAPDPFNLPPQPWQEVGHPFSITVDFINTNFGPVSTDVFGMFDVSHGVTPALFVRYSVWIGLVHGHIAFSGGTMQVQTTTPGRDPSLAPRIGQIEYRYEPDWWINAVADRLALPVLAP
jgi:hypothetical protein